jgi:pantoate--beta-alanine ligase
MNTIRSIGELRSALAQPRRAGRRIGLVPTMGALHEGHLSLLRRAREQCDLVVMSLFVNPAQFNEAADLSGYPRDELRDVRLAEQAGVDLVFAPSAEEMYPAGFATTVSVAGVTKPLEGVHRGRSHFDGVTTVVTKLLNMVGPDVAFFGQKDAQQALIIGRLVRDLDLPVRIDVRSTVREPDGLALSSRNVHLRGADRERALALRDALAAAEASLGAGERDADVLRAAALAAMRGRGVEPDYLELVRTDDLSPVTRVDGEVLVAVAASVGSTRLIDNTILNANGQPGG